MLATRIHTARNFPIGGIRNKLSYISTRAASTGAPIAFVFDIDGVLVRGSKAIPQAKPALDLLNQHKVPYILLTNGGGVTEQDRVEFLSSKIGVELSPLQIVQSHTPMKALTNKFKRVMVIGGEDDKVRKCAQYYGFEDVLMPIDLVRYSPSISPHHRWTAKQLLEYAIPPEKVNIEKPIDAILMFNDPRDMGTDIQCCLDLLNSDNGKIGTKRSIHTHTDLSNPAIPMIFSNNDFLWANDYNLPRFGQGAVRIMIESLYAECNRGAKLNSLIMGKPFKLLYDYAHHVLIDWKNRLQNNNTLDYALDKQVLPQLNNTPVNLPFERIYMVGDNPASDIKGANDNGWESLLLRTGVFKDEDWDTCAAHPTSGVYDNVYDSIVATLRKNGYKM